MLFKDFFGKRKLTDQEKEIDGIFTKLLDMHDTDKVLMNANCAYLYNHRLGICAVINGQEVIIEDGGRAVSIRCDYGFMRNLGRKVNSTLERNVDSLYYRMNTRQLDGLMRINERLGAESGGIPCGAEDSAGEEK